MRRACLFIIVCLFCSVAASAAAQPLVQKSFSTQLFEPAIGTDTLLAVEPAAVTPHLGFDLDLWLSYQLRPLVLSSAVTDPAAGAGAGQSGEQVMVSDQLTADLTGSFGLQIQKFQAQVGVALPVNLLVAGNDVTPTGEAGSSFAEMGLGDARLQLKGVIFSDLAGFSLAFSPVVTFPTACIAAGGKPCDEKGGFGGDPNFGFRPRLVADYTNGPLLLALNLGWIFRNDSAVMATVIGDRFTYGLGGLLRVHGRVDLLAELSGQIQPGSDQCRTVEGGLQVCSEGSGASLETTPLELDAAARFEVGSGFSLTAGLGAGLIRAVGSPLFRGLAAVQWAPDLEDGDRDGLSNQADQCPAQAEDADGFEDDDGCPDDDNDGDGIADGADRCPLQAEDRDEFQDGDGCPERDNDEDGVVDGYDRCPGTPEDRDGFEDDDGCPEPDNDKDGVEDGEDKCPEEQEVINGNQDTDGCPDEGEPGVTLEGTAIELASTVRFDRRGRLRAKSHGILEQLALFLKRHDQIPGVAIRVYGSARGNAKRNRELAQASADAVRVFLLERSVAAERLKAEGLVTRERRRGLQLEVLERAPGAEVPASEADAKGEDKGEDGAPSERGK